MNGCDVICATPGRLNDLLKRGLFVSTISQIFWLNMIIV